MTDSMEERNPIDVLADEFLDRYRRGERPPLSEYTDRHPELADEIRELFPLLQEMESARSDGESHGAADDTTHDATPLPRLRELGEYRILREVGRGGMGIVYEAEQISLSRRVALKVLPQQLLLNENHQRRFEREARSAGKLHHTNIVPVFGVGQADGYHFYVMQFIPGLGLDEVIDEVRRMNAPGSDGSSAPAAGSLRVVQRRDVSAADVAQSLVTGQFERTRITNESGDATLISALQEEAARNKVDRSSTSHSASDSFAVSSSSSMLGTSSSVSSGRGQHTYWVSVAHIGRQVAEALDYAHKQGVLHRDIKPSNLLLDLRGTVWVTDFGLAKANDQKDLTHTGDILGTIRYIPPESFEGTADVRGDVYSLGLTLYELLALRPAFDEQERHKLIKQVTTSIPERLEKLNPQIPRDLVTIVHKAIDRDPEHRYQTPREMAEDLERFGHDEPIRARRSTPWDRVRKWARRNPALAAASAAVVFLLMTVTVVSVVAYQQTAAALILAQQSAEQAKANEELARQNEEAAQKNAEEAQEQRNLAREVVDKMFTQVAEDWMANNASLEPLQEQFLQDALDFYTQLSQEKTNDPEVLLETGNAYRRIGEIQFKLAKNAEAEQAFLAGAEMLKKLVEAYPEEPIYREALAAIYHEYGYMCQFLAERNSAALNAYRRAYHHRNLLAESYPEVAEHRRNAALSLGGLANAFAAGGTVDERVRTYKQSLEVLATVPQELLQDPICRFRIGLIHSELAEVLRQQRKHDESWPYFDKGQSIYRQLVDDFPRNAVYRNELAWSLREESNQRWGGNRNLEKREQTIRRAVEIERQLVQESSTVADYQFVLGLCYRDLGWAVHARGKATEAQSHMRASIDVLRKLIKENPGFRSAYFASDLGRSIRGLIQMRGANITPQEKESLLRENADTHVRAFRNYRESFNLIEIRSVYTAQRDLAFARFELGDVSGGFDMLEEATAFIEARLTEDPKSEKYRRWKHEHLGIAAGKLRGYAKESRKDNERDESRRLDQAVESHHRRHVDFLREHYGSDHILVGGAVIEHSLNLLPDHPSESDRAAVVELCGRWEPVYRQHFQETLSNLSDFNAGQKQAGDHHQLGMALRGAGFVAESIPFFERVLELRRRLQPEIPNPNAWQKLEVFHSIRYLAHTHLDARDFKRSAELMRDALADVDTWVGKQPQEEHFHHWKTLQIRDTDHPLRRYAQELRKAGNEELARKVEQESEHAYTQQLSALRERFGDQHTLVALALVCTGDLRDRQRRHAEAVELFAEAVRIRQTVLGPEHADVGHALIRLGWNENAQGRIEPAVTAFREALAIFRKAYAKDSPHTAYTLYHLAGFMQRQREHAEAEELYREALDMKRRVLGEDHLDVGDCLRGVAFARFDQGNVAGAIEMLDAAKAFIDVRIAEAPHEQRFGRWKVEFSRQSADRLCNLAHRLVSQTGFAEAQPLFIRGLEAYADSDHVDLGAHWHWYRYAVLCAHLGDADEHGRVCRDMLDRFADAPNLEIVERICKSSLLLPGSVDGFEVARLLEKSAEAARGQPSIVAWYEMAAGMAEYRSGRFTESLDHFQAASSNGFVPVDTVCRFFEAMAHHHLERPLDAQSSYEAGLELMEAHVPKLDSGDLGGLWNDGLACHIARREAESVLKDATAPAPDMTTAEPDMTTAEIVE